MNIRHADWAAHDATGHAAPALVKGGSMGAAVRGLHPQRESRTLGDRWPSLVFSAAGHLLLAGLVLSATVTAVTPLMQEKTITVSIADSQSTPTPPAPEPPMPPLVKRVQMVPPPDASAPSLQIAAAPTLPEVAPSSAAPVASAPPVQKAPAEPETTPPRFDADYLNNPSVAYPNMSRRLREVGTVQLRVRVSADGQALEILLAGSSGYPRLDAAARDAVKKWRFQAAMRGGAPVEAWVLVPIEFSLGAHH